MQVHVAAPDAFCARANSLSSYADINRQALALIQKVTCATCSCIGSGLSA